MNIPKDIRSLMRYPKWLYRNSLGVRKSLLWNVLTGGASVCLSLLFVMVSKKLVDAATENQGSVMLTMSALMILIILLRLGLNAFGTRLENVTYAKMDFIIRKRLFTNLLQAQWKGKEKRHSGDTLNRLFSDVDTVTKVICSDMPSMVTTLFQLFAAVCVLAFLDIRLAIIILIITPFFILFSKVFFRRMRQYTRDIRETESRVQSHIQESLQHKTVIQSLDKGGMVESRLENLQQDEYGQIMRRTNFNIISRTLVSAAFQFGYAVAFLWSVVGISKGTVTYGMMTAFLQLVAQIQNPTMRLSRQIPSFIYATASIDRLMELEDSDKEEKGEQIVLESPAGIRLDGISFKYPDGESMVFDGFSWDFKPGTKTAITGETGVGKSTLIKLMLSILRPTGGTISIYDNLQSVEASPLTRVNIVYVPQGNTLFSGSIQDNLLMGDPDADEQRMWQALEVAAADFVHDLPDGLMTMCGEQGAGLSEGQAQRIAIARGLLRPGSIMLLDEFSSSLDPETEERLMKNLTEANPEKTMIFITHREKITEYCDSILSLD